MDIIGGGSAPSQQSPAGSDAEKNNGYTSELSSVTLRDGNSSSIDDSTHRKLQSRHIQLIGIGGTIGTALFVQIGKALYQGGPGSLLIAFAFWCFVVLSVTVSMAEMVSYLPISSPFIRFAGRWVDEALGFAAGWNFFIFQAAMVTFEITACNIVLRYWTDAVPTWAVITTISLLYTLINTVAVRGYGETEFWAALGKVVLILALLAFTFVAMLGGNPKHDRFGFRTWRDPGAFAAYYRPGGIGRFMGFMQCLIQASFTVAGPEYISMSAGEAVNPRRTMPRAFKAAAYRMGVFFILGAMAVGVLVPHDDKTMREAFERDLPGAAASPYVLGMRRLGITVFPDMVNAMVLTSTFSAGNSYVYCASRSLFGLALEGKAPRILTTCLPNGVPIYSVGVVLAISLLSFLQISETAGTVLGWFVSLVTASQLLNFAVMCVTYLCFYQALKAQGVDRRTLTFRGWGQPWVAMFGLVMTLSMAFVGGYNVFLPGQWKVTNFLFSYTMMMVCPILYVGWKLIHKTKMPSARERDLKRDLARIEDYTENFVETKSGNRFERVLDRLLG